MYKRYPSIRLFNQKFRNISTSSCVCKRKPNHYDSLGITPKATQADVKTAYYELSKVYHPDRNEGSENASQKFRDITEAYEILGNVNSRKLYDKGMSIGTTLGQRSQSDERMYKFYRSRDTKTRPTSSGGRQPIYDFDEWSKSHYGATFARDMANKQRKQRMKQNELAMQQSDRMEKVLLCVGAVMFLCMYAMYGSTDYDDVTIIGDVSINVSKRDD